MEYDVIVLGSDLAGTPGVYQLDIPVQALLAYSSDNSGSS